MNALAELIGRKAAAKLPEMIRDIVFLSPDDLMSYGLTPAQAAKVHTAVRIASRIAEPSRSYSVRITSSQEAMRYCESTFTLLMSHGQQEEFHVVTLDTKNQPIRNHLITRGTLDASLVHPREVFRPAIVDSSASVILVHNHPSGDPTPSKEDFAVTRRMESAGELLGITVLDHIVLGRPFCASIRESR